MKFKETIYINNPGQPFGEHTTIIALNHWQVVNAPRPIPGMVTWQGDFRHGIFYAAGPIEQFGQSWNELDAWPVEAITNLQIVEKVKAMCEERDTTLAEVLDSFDGDWYRLAAACEFPWKQVGI